MFSILVKVKKNKIKIVLITYNNEIGYYLYLLSEPTK